MVYVYTYTVVNVCVVTVAEVDSDYDNHTSNTIQLKNRTTELDNYRRSIYTVQNMNMINYISYLITKPKTKELAK